MELLREQFDRLTEMLRHRLKSCDCSCDKVKTSCILTAAAIVPAWTLLALRFGLFCSLFSNISLGILFFIGVDFLLNYEKDFPFLVACKKYALYRLFYFGGYFIRAKLNQATRDIGKLQSSELRSILKYNNDTAYFKDAGLEKVRTREDYVRVHPLVKYDHFRSYFDRMLNNGEEKVMTSDPPRYYGETSGTTGKPSRIPVVQYQRKEFFKLTAFFLNAIGDDVPGSRKVRKTMKLYYNVPRLLERSANGTRIGPLSAAFQGLESPETFTTPPAGYDIPHEESTRYIHLLFGLRYRRLKRIETIFVSLAYFAFMELEAEWKSLVRDIRYGTLKEDLQITPETRRALLLALMPDPERADELEVEFNKGMKNIAKRIWPELAVIDCVAAGPFVHYAEALRQHYTGDILIYSPFYGASEGLFGINLWPFREPINYLLWPCGIFYEFIPLEHVTDANPPTVFMDQVKKGEMYEMVLTTPTGLYRYRLGDIVKIADFYNQCPVIEFQYRSGQLLNIKAEKVSEVVMLDAIKEVIGAQQGSGINRVVDFTACESLARDNANIPDAVQKSSTPCYVVFLEVNVNGGTDLPALEHDFTVKLDETLMKNHSDYSLYRKKNAIDHLELHFVKPGAFQRLRNYMLDTTTTSPSQLKIPRVLRKTELVRFMWNERIQAGQSDLSSGETVVRDQEELDGTTVVREEGDSTTVVRDDVHETSDA
ncbi:uncharacterized protein LOC129584056 [Paramacrobiotus metropolitanus]|uniref:uncharacterized protein LOC129584056 n=1 Tax=Paramacrobiotus metropolitanus TaxID=2943436 RepID=UPI002445CCF4|nr:uncharacterized protein LOC129584056 [Paramacrobiotus metropolitanus]